jgi:hypothetical protein
MLTDVSDILTASIIRAMIALMMEALNASETFVHIHNNALCNISEDSHHQVLIMSKRNE